MLYSGALVGYLIIVLLLASTREDGMHVSGERQTGVSLAFLVLLSLSGPGRTVNICLLLNLDEFYIAAYFF